MHATELHASVTARQMREERDCQVIDEQRRKIVGPAEHGQQSVCQAGHDRIFHSWRARQMTYSLPGFHREFVEHITGDVERDGFVFMGDKS